MTTETFTFDRAETMEEYVFQALGAASVCWKSMDGTGVFDSNRAKAIGDELVRVMRAREDQPRLGLSTTDALLTEIRTRIEMDWYAGGGGLGYSTVAGREQGKDLHVLAPGEEAP